jgi:hypothetical protein
LPSRLSGIIGCGSTRHARKSAGSPPQVSHNGFQGLYLQTLSHNGSGVSGFVLRTVS